MHVSAPSISCPLLSPGSKSVGHLVCLWLYPQGCVCTVCAVVECKCVWEGWQGCERLDLNWSYFWNWINASWPFTSQLFAELQWMTFENPVAKSYCFLAVIIMSMFGSFYRSVFILSEMQQHSSCSLQPPWTLTLMKEEKKDVKNICAPFQLFLKRVQKRWMLFEVFEVFSVMI